MSANSSTTCNINISGGDPKQQFEVVRYIQIISNKANSVLRFYDEL